jgi:hypothetical protein
MKSQSELMEYIIMTVIVIVIIILVVIFIFGFQYLSASGDRTRLQEQRLDYLLDAFVESQLLNEPGYPQGLMFDDSKLTALAGMQSPESCPILRGQLGSGWYAEIKVVLDPAQCSGLSGGWLINCMRQQSDNENRLCTGSNYPECGRWEFCSGNREERMRYTTMPVNVYRKINNTVSWAVLKIGVSGE